MDLYIGWIWCRIRGHLYRRARKGEDAGMKYCQRCAVSVAVKRRMG